MSEWISVKEKLPEMRKPYQTAEYRESERVLIHNGHYASIGVYGETFRRKSTRWTADGRVSCPTHWMPLPEPPKAESAGGK